ncbi:MAG: hypothetical protein QW292_05200 [Candidatus Parvarchaeota archaeon]
MNSNSIVQDQIFFLRHLARLDSDIKVSLNGRSKWLDLYDVVRNPPNFPIVSRSILRNELVLELDDDSWEYVRDGTRRIIQVLEKWGARDAYYLSYSGNRSLHVHVFFNPSSLKINNDTGKVLEGVDKDEVRKVVKTYLMRQVSLASDTSIDLNLSSIRHLIRLEGSVNEKSGMPCTQISTVPDNKPMDYPVKIPGPNSLPARLWDISFMETEINSFLKIRFAEKEPIHYITSKSTKPIENPERLIEILRPVYVKGYRHYLVLSLSGFLKRHSVSLNTAQGIIKQLANKDEEFPSRLYNLKEIYKADNSKRLYGFPQLVKIIRKEMEEGKITQGTAKNVISQLETIARGGSEHEAY